MIQLFRTAVLTIGWLLVAGSGIILLSGIFPVIPWLRIYATSMIPNYMPWFVVTPVVGLCLGSVMHYLDESPNSWRLKLIGLATSLLGAGMMAHMLFVAYSNGGRISLPSTFSLRDFGDTDKPDETRVFSRPDGEDLSLDIYSPGITRYASPVLVAIHGGGFVQGSRRFGAANLRWFADHGWTVISIDYRLATPGRPTWNLATRDVECALAWVARHARPLHIDLKRLTLTGGSAGGSLAIKAAYAGPSERIDPICGPQVPRARVVIAKSPLLDIAGAWRKGGELQKLQHSFLTQYLGGSPEQYPARYTAADPRRLLNRSSPPTLITNGAADPLVPPEGADDFTRQAKLIGANVRHFTFPYSGHDFNTMYYSITNQSMRQIMVGFMIQYGAGPREK